MMTMGVFLVSCAPEPSSQVYSQEVVGLSSSADWSNSSWKVKLPDKWIAEPVFGMRDASFRVVGEQGMEAEVAISRLPIGGGTLASNVNRWRQQAGLESWDESKVVELLTPILISGNPAYRMEFQAPDANGQTIYGVIMETEAERIFIKFSGPANLMESQQEAWSYFVENLELRNAA